MQVRVWGRSSAQEERMMAVILIMEAVAAG